MLIKMEFRTFSLKFGASENKFSFVLHQICNSRAFAALKKTKIVSHLNQYTTHNFLEISEDFSCLPSVNNEFK